MLKMIQLWSIGLRTVVLVLLSVFSLSMSPFSVLRTEATVFYDGGEISLASQDAASGTAPAEGTENSGTTDGTTEGATDAATGETAQADGTVTAAEGTATVPSTPVQEIWTYKGRSGKFVHPTEGASFSTKEKSILTVNADGRFKAKKVGTATLIVTLPLTEGMKPKDRKVLYTIRIIEYPEDFTISPKNAAQKAPIQDASYAVTTSFRLKGVTITPNTPIEVIVASGDMTPEISRSGKTVTLSTKTPGNCTVHVYFAGVRKTFKWMVQGVGCKVTSYVVPIGTVDKIGVSYVSPSAFKWTSTDANVVRVSSDGEFEALNAGNVVLKGINKVSKYKVGCVISVTTQEKIDAIERGKAIAQGTYSLSRRMQEGYYDCSSLVWRAFLPSGVDFGVPAGGYAPVAGTECKYLEDRGQLVGTWLVEDMKSLRYQAGDMMFRTNTGNGHYRNINHVEIISGYLFKGFDASGNSDVVCTWVNRPPEYSDTINAWDLIGRP